MNKIVNRRDVLSATATAGIIGVGGSSGKAATVHLSADPASHEVSPMLISMISEFEKLKQEREALNAQMDLAWMRDDRPTRVSVKLGDVCGRALDYPPHHLEREFFTTSLLDRFFEETRRSYLKVTEPLETRRQADWRKARSILEDRDSRFEAWEQASGWNDLERRYDEIYGHVCDLEDAICSFECGSIGDMITKIRFTQKWMNSDDLEWSQQHATVLASMFELASRHALDGAGSALVRSN